MIYLFVAMKVETIKRTLGITKQKIPRTIEIVPSVSTHTFSDIFVKQPENIDLHNIKFGKYINEGREAQVFESNYPDYVIRIVHGKIFNTMDLKKVDNVNGLICATDEQGTIQVLKKVQGEPLYGTGWNILEDASKDNFINGFKMIRNLPDKSFLMYFKNVLSLRKLGFNTDIVSPNNFLIDGNNINIVDIAKEKVEPRLTIKDIYPFLDNFRLQKLLISMEKRERDNLLREIRAFLSRMIRISRSAGSKIDIDTTKNSNLKDLLVYIYNDDKYMINALVS